MSFENTTDGSFGTLSRPSTFIVNCPVALINLRVDDNLLCYKCGLLGVMWAYHMFILLVSC